MSGPNKVDERLSVSGWPDNWGVAPDFPRIINLYPWQPYLPKPGQIVLSVALEDDQARPPDARLVRELALIINRWRESFEVLVHCQAGLNRSCLIAAEAMILRGRGPREAISLIRQRHDEHALFNQQFIAHLMAQERR